MGTNRRFGALWIPKSAFGSTQRTKAAVWNILDRKSALRESLDNSSWPHPSTIFSPLQGECIVVCAVTTRLATGKITRKIDVYAFGVILLELMTSRKVLDDTVPDEDANLVAAFRRIHPRDIARLERFVDSSIFSDEESRSSIADLAEIAYHCTSREPSYRPEMSNVVTMLSPIADRWCPGNYGDGTDDGDSTVSLTSMVHRWQMSDDSSYNYSFSNYRPSTSNLR